MLVKLRTRTFLLCCVLAAAGCDASHAARDGALPDAGPVAQDADAPPDAGPLDHPDAGSDAHDAGNAHDAGSDAPDAGPMDPVDPGPNPAFEVEMVYVTANVGRNYDTRGDVRAVFNRIEERFRRGSVPTFIGWQEIGEGDPCGGRCEIDELRAQFGAGWSTRRPRGMRPGGGSELVKVPVTWRAGGADVSVRAVYASAGWAGVSPTRFVTVVRYPRRKLSIVNTHFIAGAWSCKSHQARRREYWRDAWRVLKAEVAQEHRRGSNVIITGDLNRPRGANSCNPAWEPASVHSNARIIGGAGIDYVMAVPARGWGFAISRRGDGSRKRGSVRIGIDGHKAHFVAGRFRRM